MNGFPMPHRDLETDRLVLTPMTAAHATERYLAWLDDAEVNRYLETRFEAQTLEGLRDYIGRADGSGNTALFAIIERASGAHIGNIKLGPVNRHHSSSAIGLVIGERTAWGRGYASEAIGALADWAFDVVGLRKLTAGAYEQNRGSVGAFLKCGFAIEGVQRDQVVSDEGERMNVILLGKTYAEHEGTATEVRP